MAGPPSKSEESKLDKIKQFLGIRSTGKGGKIQVGKVQLPRKEFVFTPELIKEISPGSPANHRLNTIRDLCEKVQTRRLEENALAVLWDSIHDLLQPSSTSEERHTAFTFLQCLVKGQYEQLGMMRAKFFDLVKNHNLFEDLPYRLELLCVLSKDGKDLEHFEEETGPFLAEWMRDVMSSPKIADFLKLAVNVIKFNAAYMDEEIISRFVLNTCLIATKTGQEADRKLCLKVLDTVVCYSFLPSESLYHFTVCLCQVVNIETFCQDIWALMRKLLGTHLGHSTIYTMCCILQDKNHVTDSGATLLRGAVFFIGMALWSPKRVASLKYPPSSVLPSFLQALIHSNSSIVAFEVILSVHRLVNKQGQDLQLVTWDIILDIVELVLAHIEATVGVNPDLVGKTHALLSEIEGLHEQGHLTSSSGRFFNIIETCAHKRPESSILLLVCHKAQSINSARDKWIESLNDLIDRYFKQEVRTKIRLKVLDVLLYILGENSHLYQDDLIELVIQPNLTHIHSDLDLEVRKRGAQLLVDLAATCQSARCLDVLELLKKIIRRSMTGSGQSQRDSLEGCCDPSKTVHSDLQDIDTAVTGLVSIFRTKLLQLPSSHTLRVFEHLTQHLQCHYSCRTLLLKGGTIRAAILKCFLELRADDLDRLGLPDPKKEGHLTYSPYIVCTYREESCCNEKPSGPPASPTMVVPSPSMLQCNTTIVSYAEAFTCIRLCLEQEVDWAVLKLVLRMLPQLLQNKTLILAARTQDIEHFAARLCVMFKEKNLPGKLLNTPSPFTRSDFHSHVLPVLACLVSYHSFLDKARQTELVICLEFGLVSKCSRICIRALTVCALEMQDVMMRHLPSILLNLSKISATVAQAIPLMEFLSSLTHIPQLYANFVGDQYMSIFAIALPYTNPFKYTHYTVSLAYHVIAMWFLKCRLPLRRGFVGFIVKGLKANVLRQLEETSNQRARQNQDSADRTRTQSLNEEAMRRSRAAARQHVQNVQHTTMMMEDSAMSVFHKELLDTCFDMMARYAFSTCFSMPNRSAVSEFLLKGGQSSSWLLGNKIISITTSGGSRVGKAGLCEKCLMLARIASARAERSQSNRPENGSGRRRHKSAAVRTISEVVNIKRSSQDDIQIHRQHSEEDEQLFGMNNADNRLTDSLEELRSRLNGEQTRAPIQSRLDKMQAVDSVLMGLSAKPSDQSIFTPLTCNCWCTQWAEVHIRRPTGNLSWMMRIQNEQDLTEVFPEFPLEDISNLFMSGPEDSYEDFSKSRINSLCLEETEYENMMEEHFYGSSAESTGKRGQLSMDDRPSLISQSIEEIPNGESEPTGSQDEVEEDILDPELEAALRKSSSSPDLTVSQQMKLQDGAADSRLQQAYDKSKQLSVGKATSLESVHSIKGEGANPAAEDPSPSKQESSKSLSHSSSSVPDRPGTSKASPALGNRHLSPGTTNSSEAVNLGSHTPEAKRLGDAHISSKPASPSASLTPESKRTPAEVSHHSSSSSSGKEHAHGGVSPSFLFLQLYHSNFLGHGDDRPVVLPDHQVVSRALKMLDLIYPYETCKIGVLYVGPGQASDQTAILSNVYGSPRYMMFLNGLGHLLRLKDCQPQSVYVGGLDVEGEDGDFAYAWHDEFMQVIFHVATLMPNKESDPNCNGKKLHIGNNYVTIVYNDSKEKYTLGTIKGQFNYVNVVIEPLDHGSNAVTVQTRHDIEDVIGHTDTKVISDGNLAVLVRQMAVHAHLASIILQKQESNHQDPYASNWLERLRQIKRIHSKVKESSKQSESSGGMGAGPGGQSASPGQSGQPTQAPTTPIVEDFTDFV